MYHSFLIHSSADGHLGCFHVLAIINSAAMEAVKVAAHSGSLAQLCCGEGRTLQTNAAGVCGEHS